MTPSRRASTEIVDGLSVVRRAARTGLPTSDGTSPVSPFDGTDGVRADAAPTVLLVHGAMDRAASFGRVMRRLPEIETLAVDRRGYGGSVDAGVASGLAAHVADLRTVIDWSGAGRVVVVGHSLGGRLALELAARHDPRVVAVAAFEAPVPGLDGSRERVGGGAIEVGRTDGPEAAAEHFYRRMVGEATWERLRQRDRAARRSEGAALLAELVDVRDGPELDVASIDLPVVIGVGERSGDSLRAGSAALHERLARARFVEIAGAGHGAHLTHPDEFARYVRTTVELAAAAPDVPGAPSDERDPGANPFDANGGSHTSRSAR